MTVAREGELRDVVMDIVREDYKSLSSVISRIEGYQDALRGVALTAWATALGVAFSNESTAPLIVAMPLMLLLGWNDMRLDYQYAVAHRRSYELEKVVQAYVDYMLEIGRPLQTEVEEKFQLLLDQYEFGSNLNLISPTVRKVFDGSSRVIPSTVVFFSFLYLVLAAATHLV